jgi:acyl CoA:acetate/3-ketoacid CoA transferase alpha subunit
VTAWLHPRFLFKAGMSISFSGFGSSLITMAVVQTLSLCHPVEDLVGLKNQTGCLTPDFMFLK